MPPPSRHGRSSAASDAAPALDLGNGFSVWQFKAQALVAGESQPPAYTAERTHQAGASDAVPVALVHRPGTESAPAGADEMVWLPHSAIEAAQRANNPFRRPAPRPDHGPGGGPEVLGALADLLEGLRLLGPSPVAPPHPTAEVVGPMMTTQHVVRATKTSRQNLAAQAKKRRLVRLASSQRTQWWPTFQFRRVGDRVVPNPAVQALWAALPAGTASDWDHAAWLCTPRHDLDGDAPIDLATDEDAVNRPPLRGVLAAYIDRLVR